MWFVQINLVPEASVMVRLCDGRRDDELPTSSPDGIKVAENKILILSVNSCSYFFLCLVLFKSVLHYIIHSQRL